MIKQTTLSIIVSSLFTILVFLPFMYLIFTQSNLTIEIIIATIIAFTILVLHLLFLIQSITHQRKAYTMTYGLLLGIIASMIAGFKELSIQIPFLPEDYAIYISLTMWSFTYFLIYLFFESLYSDQLHSTRLFIVTSLLAISVFSHLTLMFVSGTLSDALWLWADLSYGSMGILIFGFGIFVLYQSYNYVHRDRIQISQMTGLGFILSGFLISFISDFSFIINSIIGIRPSDFIEPFFGDLLKVIGIIIFAATYIIEIDYIYRLPFPIHAIITFKTNSGLCLNITNVKNVSEDKKVQIEEQLITGTISAIMSLLKEGFGSKGVLKSIISSDLSIVVSSNSEISIAAITDRPTKMLRYSIELALKQITTTYGETIRKQRVVSVEEFKDTPVLLKKSFPYLIFS